MPLLFNKDARTLNIVLSEAQRPNSQKESNEPSVAQIRSNGGEKMDEFELENLKTRSNDFKNQLIAMHMGLNSKFAQKLASDLEGFQIGDKFLSRKTLKGYRKTIEYECILDKDLFEAFIDTEISIKRMYHEDASKKAKEEALKKLMEY